MCEVFLCGRLRYAVVFVSIRHLFWMSKKRRAPGIASVPKATILQQVSIDRDTRKQAYEGIVRREVREREKHSCVRQKQDKRALRE